ncbi:MAG: hypothetical protein JWM67_3269 [Mycobacterium sp.]|nr:hypothetical protein [Mycobacterium sp.]
MVGADLVTRDGGLLINVADTALAAQLPGQVVALSVGRRSSRFRRGWTVAVHGVLGQAPPDDPEDLDTPPEVAGGVTLALAIAQLDGTTLARRQGGRGLRP